MRAIVKQGRSVRACRVPVPEPGPGEVLIRVEAAGICRTDIYVAQGKLPCADPLILGHEFAGVVASCGSDIHSFAPGDRVAAMPVIPCGACVRCTGGMPECCPNHQFLGVSRHGAFAEYVAVPAQVVHQLPPSLSFRQGAYTEPVCASLAVLKASIKPGDSGLIHGENRIAELTKRVLSTAGFPAVRTQRLGQSLPQETDAYDFIIETQPSSPAFDEMIRAVRPGGRIILKSRPAAPVAIDLAAAVRKEVIFESVSYGTFPESLEFLTRHDLADLLGQTHPLEDFVDIFATDRAGENLKSFLSPGAGDADPGISTPSTFTSTDSAKPGIPVTAPCG
ncbi:alcohol dehydrogenase catalytic domain-containing protein [Mycobacterium europaeum]|uniref:zinc-dependent alcohol dehydrogenase n=1 Tax=Mycobacterium europaeum TaxID=761804 RepID=UPI002AE009EF|nr:alcohol dehydrogenase catalytic domain-containing protein [Mycobacterium europaeum]MEA1162572.1 alcohol dehydrogenase catalytic domain-containing protein [Mycobacterium europaeum]